MNKPKTLIRKDYPRVRVTQKAGKTYYIVDLRRKHFVGNGLKWHSDRDLALKFASEIAEKVAKSGITSISRLTDDPRITTWTEQAAVYQKTIDEVFALGLEQCKNLAAVSKSPFMGSLLSEWQDDKTTNKLKPLRARSIETIKFFANKFQSDFGKIRIKQLSRDKIETYLSSLTGGSQYKKNALKYLSQFLNWCIRKNHIKENPSNFIEITVIPTEIEFLTVTQCEELMKIAVKHNMSGYFALALFAGIRPRECERLNWSNIDMDKEEISLSPTITKTKKSRRIHKSDINTPVFAWLKTLDQSQPLINTNCHKLKQKVITEYKSSGKQWPIDVLRHTFATYHYCEFQELERLRSIMGNSPDVIEKFYKGNVGKDQSKQFNLILPVS